MSYKIYKPELNVYVNDVYLGNAYNEIHRECEDNSSWFKIILQFDFKDEDLMEKMLDDLFDIEIILELKISNRSYKIIGNHFTSFCHRNGDVCKLKITFIVEK